MSSIIFSGTNIDLQRSLEGLEGLSLKRLFNPEEGLEASNVVGGMAMDLKKITANDGFDEMIQNGVALVDFNAPWCAPCRLQEPILDRLAGRYAGRALVAEINVDNHSDLAMSYGIRSIPTIIVFKNGREMHRFVGLQDESVLSDILDAMLN